MFKNSPVLKTLFEIYYQCYAGVGQNNGNTKDAVHISLLIWCWTTFAFNRATALLGTDSYTF
jgi:hypothetical protein